MFPHLNAPAHVSKVLVFGAGNFASCLADHLGDSEHEVYIWSRKISFVNHFNLHHRNPDYLKEHLFSHNIQAVGPDLPNKDFISSMEVLLFAIPTQAVRFVSMMAYVQP
jgi:glycerol-3-phosphate dehydrogenase